MKPRGSSWEDCLTACFCIWWCVWAECKLPFTGRLFLMLQPWTWATPSTRGLTVTGARKARRFEMFQRQHRGYRCRLSRSAAGHRQPQSWPCRWLYRTHDNITSCPRGENLSQLSDIDDKRKIYPSTSRWQYRLRYLYSNSDLSGWMRDNLDIQLNTSANTNQGAASTDFKHNGCLSNWNCHRRTLHLHSEAVVQITLHDMWKGRKGKGGQ